MIEHPNSLLDAILAGFYLAGATLAGYIGWIVVKTFSFITPKASKVVAKMVTEWIIEVLKPAIEEAIDTKMKPHLDDISKIKEATHGKTQMEEGVLNRLLEVAKILEEKAENLNKDSSLKTKEE